MTTIPAEISKGLDHYQVREPLRLLLERVAKSRSVTADPPGKGYVAVRPAAWGNVSAYFHTSYVDVALTPDRAKSVENTRSWPIIKINSETGFVRIQSAALDDPETMDYAVAILLQAVDKSEVGTAYEGGGSSRRTAAPAALCPTCFLTLPASGVCDNCT